MAILTQPQLSALRARLYDFKKNLDAYVRGIQGQIIKGFSLTSEQSEIKGRYDAALVSLNTKLSRLTGVIEGRSLDGQLVTDDAVRALLESFKGDLEAMQRAVVEWNKLNPVASALSAVNSLGMAVFGSLDAVFQVVGGAAAGTAAALKWLPWVALGLIVIPPAIRVALKARRSGIDAALESTADEMDAVKQKAKDAASAAGRAAVTAGKLLLV